MSKLPKIALGAWAWGNDGTFGNDFTAETLKPIFDAAMANGLTDEETTGLEALADSLNLNVIRFWEKEMK